jgi:hydrogenase nickel incorporation protein HypA/HybF
MHELSIAMSILDGVEEEMERHGNSRVEAVYIRLGLLSGVQKEALISAYELAREETPFSDSRLIFEEVPVTVFCARCQGERPARSVQNLACAECDTPATQVIHGRELEITALELEE